jgi:hypothetical protein
MRIVLIFLLLCTSALAHDASRSELNEWFNKLASGRGLCCSFADGFAISDVDWESKGGHYRVRLENNWIDVPDDALITEPNLVGRTMVWPLRFDGQILTGASCPAAWARARGIGPALTPPIKVSSPPLQPGGFFFCSCRARQSAGSPSPAAGFEARPIPLAGKIERPIAVRTVFERPGG